MLQLSNPILYFIFLAFIGVAGISFLLFIIIVGHYETKAKELEVRYCIHCGKTISTKKVGFWRQFIMRRHMDIESIRFKYCYRCGTKNPSKGNFCLFCGDEIENFKE
ncbi:MAG: hypothetical protein ACFFBD_09570 [Candidatus Hodarchaeota archaeon]